MHIPLDINGEECKDCAVVDASFKGDMKEDMYGDCYPVVNLSVRLCKRHAEEYFGHEKPTVIINNPNAKPLPA